MHWPVPLVEVWTGVVTVWVRRCHRTRLQTCLFKAWRPNPLGQLSAEHINYYTQSIACFFLNCYRGIYDRPREKKSLTMMSTLRTRWQGRRCLGRWCHLNVRDVKLLVRERLGRRRNIILAKSYLAGSDTRWYGDDESHEDDDEEEEDVDELPWGSLGCPRQRVGCKY